MLSSQELTQKQQKFIDSYLNEPDQVKQKAIYAEYQAEVQDEWLWQGARFVQVEYFKRRDFSKTFVMLDRLETISTPSKFPRTVGWINLIRGSTFLDINKLSDAEHVFRKAESKFIEINDKRGLAGTKLYQGQIAQKRYNFKEAKKLFETAYHIYEKINLKAGQVNTLRALGDLAEATSDFNAAKLKYESALEICHETKDILGSGQILLRLGSFATAVGDYESARDNYEGAFRLYQQLNDLKGQAAIHFMLADLASRKSDYSTAREKFEQALKIFQQLDDFWGQAICLRGIGMAAISGFDRQIAREKFEAALKIYRQIHDQAGEAETLVNIGNVATQAADYETARNNFEQSFQIYRQINHQSGMASTLMRIGENAKILSDFKTAKEKFEEALKIYGQMSYLNGQAEALSHIGHLATHTTDNESARENFEKALQIYKQIGRRPGIAATLLSLGDIAEKAFDYGAAKTKFEEAQRLYEQAGSPRDELSVNARLFVLHSRQGNTREASVYLQEMIKKIKIVRSFAYDRAEQFRLQEISSEGLKLALYVFAKKDAPFALNSLEQIRGQRFNEGISLKMALEKAGINESKKSKWQILNQAYAQAVDLQRRLNEGKDTHHLESQRSKAHEAKQVAEKNLEDFERQLMTESPRFRDLVNPKIASLKEMQTTLGAGETALVYLGTGDDLNAFGVFVVTREKVTYRQLPKGASPGVIEFWRASVLQAADEKRGAKKTGLVSTEKHDLKPGEDPAVRLGQVLVEPVLDLVGASRKLVIVPDGALGLIPWEALTVKGKNFGESYRLSFAPSLGILHQLRTAPERDYSKLKRLPLLAFGGAYYDAWSASVKTQIQPLTMLERQARLDEIMTRGYRDLKWSDLPGARAETEGVAGIYYSDVKQRDAATFMNRYASEPAVKALNRGITRDSKTMRLADARVLHFSVHGKAEADFPETSRLVLSQAKAIPGEEKTKLAKEFPEFKDEDGSLLAAEIVGLDIRADVVTLSACETAMGKVSGSEGIIGLTRAFMVAGANGMVVSLWEVSDAGSRVLMMLLHRRIAAGEQPAEALAAVQKEMREGTWRQGEFAPEKAYEDNGTRKFKDLDLNLPYYWSAFQYWGK